MSVALSLRNSDLDYDCSHCPELFHVSIITAQSPLYCLFVCDSDMVRGRQHLHHLELVKSGEIWAYKLVLLFQLIVYTPSQLRSLTSW